MWTTSRDTNGRVIVANSATRHETLTLQKVEKQKQTQAPKSPQNYSSREKNQDVVVATCTTTILQTKTGCVTEKKTRQNKEKKKRLWTAKQDHGRA